MTLRLGYVPKWPAPANIGAFVTYRSGGHSKGAYHSNNLGIHVGDDPEAVAHNREQLNQQLGISRPSWLEQVHGTTVVEAGGSELPQADASVSGHPGRVCVVLSADCLPLLVCDRFGHQVAAVHCGWRGLARGIIEEAVAAFTAKPRDLLVYLGPAISARHYEVGSEVVQALAATVAVESGTFSRPVKGKVEHYYLDLYALARAQLASLGANQIYGGERCTFAEPDAFFSYRRDATTGRMASLIWLK